MANLRETNVSFCGDLFFIEIQEGERVFVFVLFLFWQSRELSNVDLNLLV